MIAKDILGHEMRRGEAHMFGSVTLCWNWKLPNFLQKLPPNVAAKLFYSIIAQKFKSILAAFVKKIVAKNF